MNILIVNGSPKGKYSTTLHSALYLEKKYPEHSFSYINAAQRIKVLERDFTEAEDRISVADLIVFCYPVYTFLVPSQLHQFIQLLKCSGTDLRGKVATQLTTSMHFYDITAHRFIEDNCADMGLPFVSGLSAGMEDLLSDRGRRQLTDWFEHMIWSTGHSYFKAPQTCNEKFTPAVAGALPATSVKDDSRRAVVVADFSVSESLRGMVDRFTAVFPYACDVIDIAGFPFMGGCISCFSCSGDGRCFYKDGFDDYLRNVIHRHDAIIYAFRVEDHSMGYLFKMYDDRQFCNGHRTVTRGTPFGYIVDGPYSKEENLRVVLEARAQVGENFLAGVATNESDPDSEIRRLSDNIAYALEHRLVPPQNFYGVGGMKIFRDLIYKMRGLMRADHKFFKTHGQYDFPHKEWGKTMATYLIGFMVNNRKVRTGLGSKISEGMISAYRKSLEK